VRVLVTSTPGRGHIGPLLPVAAALREVGHDVRWATAPEGCSTVAGLGYPVDAAGLDTAERRAAVADRLPPIMALPPRERRGALFAGFFAAAAARAMAADVRPVVESFRPDLVVHEMAELGIVPLAVERGIPHVVVAFSGPPPAYALPTITDELAGWWASLGLDLPPHAGLSGDGYLHPFPPSLHADPPWPYERMRPEPAEPTRREDAPSWLASFGSTQPAVYVTFGTEPAAASAPWPELLEAIGDRAIDALVTTGAHGDVGAHGSVPDNVRVERYVPQGHVLGRVAAVVSHAGAGTMLGAASAGVPQIVVPMFADQWDNADAIASAGAALLCEEHERSAESLGSALDQVIGDDSWRNAAATVAEELRRLPSAADHVPMLEAIARR
jgi:UDP:flavonoid glycosyltransferase YjiC (YdhE family)